MSASEFAELLTLRTKKTFKLLKPEDSVRLDELEELLSTSSNMATLVADVPMPHEGSPSQGHADGG